MANKYTVTIENPNDGKQKVVVAATMVMMNSVINDQLSKGRFIAFILPDRSAKPTHATSAAAIAWLDVQFFQLEPDNE